jgi:8-oxo-dGTP diphosphatase
MHRFHLSARQLDEEPWKQKIVTPRVSVVGIVESPDRTKILMIERKYDPMGIAWPGGMVELGETIKEAAVREVYEETGIDANIAGLFYVTSDPTKDPRWHIVIFYFIMRAKCFSTPRAGDDAAKAFWMTNYDETYIDDMIDSSRETLFKYYNWIENGRSNLMDVD